MTTIKLPPVCPIGGIDDDDAILLDAVCCQVLVLPLTKDRTFFIRILASHDTDELSYKIATREETEADLTDSFAHFEMGLSSRGNLVVYGFDKFLAAHDKEKANP